MVESTKKDIRERIREKAKEAGFCTTGFASAIPNDDRAANLAEYVEAGHYGDMAWMPNTLERRQTPQGLWPDVKSVIVLGTSYAPGFDPTDIFKQSDRGAISCYAQGTDYHDMIKKRLKQVARWLVGETSCELKVFNDTAPVMEKPLAQQAGLGWQGKHTNLVSKKFGSWMFLGEIYTTLDLTPDVSHTDRCGSCDKCLNACPTDAFIDAGKIDARHCITYLTIEYRDDIPEELMERMGNHIYGCDDCLSACPWNKFAEPHNEPKFFPRAETQAMRLTDLIALDDETFRKIFSGSPVKRTGRDRMVRNALIALGNSGYPSKVGNIKALLDDEAPVVRHAAAWALKKLNDA